MLIDNFEELIRLLLPTWLRKSRLVTLIKLLLTRVELQLSLAFAHYSKTKFDMRFTCQRQSLEALLKYYFGEESYVLDHEEISDLLIFGQNDPFIQIVPDSNSALDPVILNPTASLSWHDCEIYVPYGTNLEQVEALLRKYIFPGVRYQIILLPVHTQPGGGGSVTPGTGGNSSVVPHP